ncbi:class D beta-lactamase [Cyclobacterium sp.]|uniref:class D beta-lactamase n=1 Tax=Cyclobacterium sp. TaxID=1966343 RepID=UPI0019A19C7E|nr:class D beta-lactamase [Cyclobacterium sp.]MBD3630307.1 class D beta-lactamase [Cyclobacterium sp.]
MLRRKYLTLMLLALGLFIQVEAQEQMDKRVHPRFQPILDSAGVHGVLLLADFQGSMLWSNDFSLAEQGQLPASTFKIPHSLIALDLGIVEDEATVFPWNGEERAMSQWEQDLTFRQAFHLSCVPCYQGIARQIGVARMRDYLDRLDYGHMDVSEQNLDQFWLRGQSRISPMEQLGFLRKLYEGDLRLAPETLSVFREMMVVEETDSYRLSGKTGWSVDQGIDNGWFVGYLEKGGSVYFFASNLAPGPETSDADFLQARKGLTMEALRVLGFL